MSDKNWDDEDYEPVSFTKSNDDRWDGEDEEKVKDNWDDDDDEEQEKNKQQQQQQSSSSGPRKKSKKQIIAEKQAEKEAALAAKRAEIERMNAEMTPEEKLAEKLRLQKIQEENELQFAVDLMGIKEEPAPEVNSLADVDISTSPGLEALGAAIIKKVRDTDRLEKKNFYPTFLESFFKELCQNLEVDELKKITSVLNALYNDKVKANKPIKGKKKAAFKAKLNTGKESDRLGAENDRFIDDFDDFI